MSISKKKIAFVIVLFSIAIIGFTQPAPLDQKYVDSITKLLPHYPNDSNKVNHLSRLASMYVLRDPRLTVKYADEGADIADKINYPIGKIRCLGQAAFVLAISGEWAKSTYKVNMAIQLAEKYQPIAMVYLSNIMWINSKTREDDLGALEWVNKAVNNPFFASIDERGKWPTYMQLGIVFESLNRLDSAKYYENIILGFQKKYGAFEPDLSHNTFTVSGHIALKEKRFSDAIHYFHLADDYLGLAIAYHILQRSDSTIFFAEKGLQNGYQIKMPSAIQPAAKILAEEYAVSNPALSNKYLTIYMNSRDSLFRNEKLKALEFVNLNAQKNKFELEKKDTANKNLILMGSLLSILAMATIASFLLWRNNRFKQIANAKLEKAFHDLKSTQSQLIQSEKMASLGELTAGIAHEIQNPLNFVNNFSEVNMELIDELKTEVRSLVEDEISLRPKRIEMTEQMIDDIKANSEKINHHGQRAADIVKGMLQHSRSSSGVKEPTDINALCDEYLRLSYHGLRAKDKSFNATLITDFDNSIGNINIIPQDIGRVALNLLTNAFYAVDEKKKSGIENYEPTVSVSTKKVDGKVFISVIDNGNGISQKVLDKIFQPFFTTKPTGQGTGLGLSLSYDIVKAHGGELKVETQEEIGTTFIISLSI